MKLYLSILICLLFSCSISEERMPKNIIPEIRFESILKEMHLAQASFDIKKNDKNADIKLSNEITDIYKKHQITETDFTESLSYYSENPKKLAQIYHNILRQLTKERSSLDLKETS